MNPRLLRLSALLLLTESAAWQTAAAAEAATASASGSTVGTSIVGEREAAVGLYLLPWQEEAAGEADRPPARYDEALQALDNQQFDRRLRNDQIIAAYRRSRLSRN